MIMVLGVSALLGVLLNNRTWLLCTLILEGVILVGRCVSLVYYGISDMIVILMIAELAIAAIIALYLLKLDEY